MWNVGFVSLSFQMVRYIVCCILLFVADFKHCVGSVWKVLVYPSKNRALHFSILSRCMCWLFLYFNQIQIRKIIDATNIGNISQNYAYYQSWILNCPTFEIQFYLPMGLSSLICQWVCLLKAVRGNFRPKLCSNFRCCPQWFIFFTNLFSQRQCKNAVNIGVTQIRVVLLQFFWGEKYPFICLLDAALNF